MSLDASDATPSEISASTVVDENESKSMNGTKMNGSETISLGTVKNQFNSHLMDSEISVGGNLGAVRPHESTSDTSEYITVDSKAEISIPEAIRITENTVDQNDAIRTNSETIHDQNLQELSIQSSISSNRSITLGARQTGNATSLNGPEIPNSQNNFFVIQSASIVKDDPRIRLINPAKDPEEGQVISLKSYPSDHAKNPLFAPISKNYPKDNKGRWQNRFIQICLKTHFQAWLMKFGMTHGQDGDKKDAVMQALVIESKGILANFEATKAAKISETIFEALQDAKCEDPAEAWVIFKRYQPMRITTTMMDRYLLNISKMMENELVQMDNIYFSTSPIKTVFPIPIFSASSNAQCAGDFRNFCLKWTGVTKEKAIKMTSQSSLLKWLKKDSLPAADLAEFSENDFQGEVETQTPGPSNGTAEKVIILHHNT